jgi:hypothetical protein
VISEDNGGVSRVVALFLLLACAGQGAMDSLWCPDGCQDPPAQHATTPHKSSGPGVCLFCGTGFVVTVAVQPSAPTAERPHVVLTSSASVRSQHLHAIDHPPRLS